MLTLDVAIATHSPCGLEKLVQSNLPQVEGVTYVVSWQEHGDAEVPAEIATRKDIRIYRFSGKGLSRNRNNALTHCTADIVLHADNDIHYCADGLREVMKAYETHPDMALATFRVRKPGGCVYPDGETLLNWPLPKNYWCTSFEMSIRRSALGNLLFHPELGLGADRIHGGEDDVYLCAAIRRGYECHFIPVIIGEHIGHTTGTKPSLTDGNILAQGCCIELTYGPAAHLRIILKWLRMWRSGQAPFWKGMRLMARGRREALRLRKATGAREKYLW